MKAWLFQDFRQKQKLGDKCPWSVGWRDTDGKRKSKRLRSKTAAEQYARKIEGQLAAGVYKDESRKKWAEFRAEYEEKVLPLLSVGSWHVVKDAFNHFEKLISPQKLSAIKTTTIDDYKAKRSLERGRKPGSTVSPATVNRELRTLKAALRIAQDWGYMPVVPKFRKLRESDQIGPVVSPDHFQAIYEAADTATKPDGIGCEPAVWWRALFAFAMTTGWRISEILSLRRDDLNLETGAIVTRAANNKGKRDDTDYLPPAILEIVKLVVRFEPTVFWWPLSKKSLQDEFHRIQKAAGIKLACPKADEHECTDSCHWYGFHALRRGYATLNTDTMPAPVLQKKMRHKAYSTTLRYIALADKMKKSSEAVHVPAFLQTATAG